MQDAVVIIPTYNEIENIEAILSAVFALPKAFDVLVVDDNSPDQTAVKVKALQSEYNNQLFLEVRKEKSGLGESIVRISVGLENHKDIISDLDGALSVV